VQPGWSGGPLIGMDKGTVVAVFHSLYQPKGSMEGFSRRQPHRLPGRPAEAVRVSDLSALAHPSSPTLPRPPNAAESMARELRAMSWAAVGNWRRAEEEQRETVKLLPEDGLAHVELGRLLLEQQKYEAAEKELQTAVKLAPKSMTANLFLGRALHLNYSPKGALAALKAAIEASPGEVEPQLRTGGGLPG